MLLTYKSLEWINEHKRKYKNNKNNKNIIEFLDLLELYSDIITSNNNDEVFNVNTTVGLEDFKADFNNIIQTAINKDDDAFFKFLIDNKLIIDIYTTDIEFSFNVGNNYVDENIKILDYAFEANKCKVAKLIFDNLDETEKNKFIESLNMNEYNNKYDFLRNHPCFTKIVRPYYKNINSAAKLMALKKSRLPNNVLNYVIGPMMGLKKTKGRKRTNGGRKTRKMRH